MNNYKPFLTLILAIILVTPAAEAQEADSDFSTKFMMMNRHQCPYDNMDEVMDLTENLVAPILQTMEDEGEITDWGVLTHAWGDEWNYNFFITAESQEAFFDAWNSFTTRSDEADPEWFERFAPLCTAHKDNMFVLHDFD